MNTHREGRERRLRGERGVALVEFALIFPIFITIVLGMFGGGLAYDRKNTMTNAVGEASRYGATLAPSTLVPSPPNANGRTRMDAWVLLVADAVQQNADGVLDDGVEDLYICVAYIHPAGTDHYDLSHKVVRTQGGSDSETFGATEECWDDERPNTERRVQILVTRPSPIQAALFQYEGLILSARSVTRFEATSF